MFRKVHLIQGLPMVAVVFFSMVGVLFFMTDSSGKSINRKYSLDQVYYDATFKNPYLEGKTYIGCKDGKNRLFIEAEATFHCDTCSRRTYFYLTNKGDVKHGVQMHERGLKENEEMAIRMLGGGFVLRVLENTHPERYDTLTLYDPFEQIKFGDAPLKKFIDQTSIISEE